MLDNCFVLHWISLHSCRTAKTREAAKEPSRRNDDRLICKLGRQSICVQERSKQGNAATAAAAAAKEDEEEGRDGKWKGGTAQVAAPRCASSS